MEGPGLDPQELDAIREAMQDGSPAPTGGAGYDDVVTPLSLISDDRAAVSARPTGMKLGERWLREWVDLPLDSVQLLEQLTMLGLEVDFTLPASVPMPGLVVGSMRCHGRWRAAPG